MPKNILGQEIELTEHVIKMNEDQIQSFLRSAIRFEKENDLKSCELYLKEAEKLERTLAKALSLYSSVDRAPHS